MTNVPGIPTRYAGVLFRSRLEARWAVFFDRHGWAWDYEPMDLRGWLPDFRLTITGHDYLIEVKPVTSPPVWVMEKIRAAHPELPCLILGLGPVFAAGREAWLGWDVEGEPRHLMESPVAARLVWREAGTAVQWMKT